ncbi:hypothetical protein, partial [Alistipes putredinis]|uniref:hypothetical protein n=1 Tax=Alistipes putredinis TaxID=28117 RepID=UPI003A93F01C
IRQPAAQSKLRELRQRARSACFVPVMQKMQNNRNFTLSRILADFSIGFSRPQRPLLPLGAHKRKRLGNHQITKPFHQSG